MSATLVDRAIAKLDRAGNRIKCSELEDLLSELGFYFKNKKTNNHKLYFHDHLPNFTSASFNCEHSKDPAVKSGYVQRAKRELTLHREDLIKFLVAKEKKQ